MRLRRSASLAESTCLDTVKTEWIRKEQDELLQAVEGLCMERDSARQESADSHQWIDHLLGEFEKERELKIEAKDVAASLAVEVAQQCGGGAHKLHEHLNHETPAFLVAFPHGT
jgi:hypothetical protein